MKRFPALSLAALAGAILSFDGYTQPDPDERSAETSSAPSGENTAPQDELGDVDVELRDLPELPGRLGDVAEDDDVDAPDENPRPVTRFETMLEMNRLASAERYDEALPLAEQLIRLTEQEFGTESIETAEAYHSAAEVQRDAGEHELAEQSYLRAVELFRAVDGPYTARAIEPLIGLGDNYQAAGQHLNAVTVYNEARTISRRVHGLLNEGQVPILDRITEAFQALGQYVEAEEQQRTILHLAERNYPQGSLEHLEALYRYARWLRSSGRFHDERTQYARAMRLIREMHGKESTLLVRPLREVANSFREQRLPDNQGVSSLRTALELLDKDADANTLLRAEVLRDMGDWEVAFSRVEPDLDTYVRAWTLLGDVENGEELRRDWFGQLQSVYTEPISDQGLSHAPDAVQGYVIVTFDVDRFGRTSDVRVARSDPRGYKDDAVIRALQRWRFRPLIENGEIVPRDDVALRFNYRYLPDSSASRDEGAG